MVGEIISHYDILEKLGEGGMGVVYKARDTHLDRFVAIKVLPPERVADPERKRRFVQEAKAASALNHPNIVHIYDIDQQDGVDFIAMEHVQGKTLGELIGRKGLKLGGALKYGVQIADALSRAHSAGIIHRDLKPGNVMVDEHGLVKVLDFGLAKLTETAPSGEDESTQTLKPTTEEGTIVGTAAYMSPEQAEGKKVDARSDIFSFGSVLYEMVTGRRAFQGDTRASTQAAVLKEEPKPASQIAPDLPKEAERLIRRCLRKDPAHRFQHMDDLKVALEDLKEESDSGTLASPSAGPSRKRARWRVAAAAAVLLLAAGASWYLWQSLRMPTPAPRIVSLTTYPGIERQPAFSPDGRQVVFSWNGQKQDNEDIYVQVVGSPEPLRRTTDPAPDRWPVWSPDGTQIAFVRDTGDQAAVYLTPAQAGQERKLADFRTVPRLYTLLTPAISWSPDGKWLAIPELEPDGTNGISLVSIQSGGKRKLISKLVSAGHFYSPAFSPKGDLLAYVLCTGERSCDVNVLDIGRDCVPKGQPQQLTQQGALFEGIAFGADGRSLIYGAALDLGSSFYLWRVPVSGGKEPDRLELTGADVAYPNISPAGNRLAYSRSEGDMDIWKFEGSAPAQRFLSSTRREGDPHFSPDGKRIAFVTTRSGKGTELWVANRDGTNLVRLTEGTGRMRGSPRWSPDSGWIAFDAQGEDGHWDIYLIDAAGGQSRRVTSEPSEENLPSWSRDGKWIYFTSDRSGRYEVWRMPAAGGESIQITHDGGFEASESWDGKTLYYTKERSSPLFARPLAGGEERQVLVSVSLLSFAVARNGIYHVVQRSAQGPLGFEIRFLDLATGMDRVLHRAEFQPVQGLAVSPDGKTILYSAVAGRNADLMLVENFR